MTKAEAFIDLDSYTDELSEYNHIMRMCRVACLDTSQLVNYEWPERLRRARLIRELLTHDASRTEASCPV